MSVIPARRPASEFRMVAWRRCRTEAIVHRTRLLTLPEYRAFRLFPKKERNIFIFALIRNSTLRNAEKKIRSEEHET